MSQELGRPEQSWSDRRQQPAAQPAVERRQFADAHSELSAEARELALAIDNYKRAHRRRFITHEEMISVIKSLGYRRS
jgi:hypothetical protein